MDRRRSRGALSNSFGIPPHRTGSIPLDLLFGAAFGPYYFVFLIAVLALITPAFARMSKRTILWLTLAFFSANLTDVVYSALSDRSSLGAVDSTIALRYPHLWWGYFPLGWVVRDHYEAISSFVILHRKAIIGACGVYIAWVAYQLYLGLLPPASSVAAWFVVLAVLLVLFAIACGREFPDFVRALSEITFPIYLFHLFFVYVAQDYVPHPRKQLGFVELFVPWLAGLLGSLLIIYLGRRLLGKYSRTFIGG